MSQLPFSYGNGQPVQPTHHQTGHNNNTMSASNHALPPTVPQTQQAAFMQNAQLPGTDMAAVLQGITPEQLAYIAQLYQSGLIPLPAPQPSMIPQSLATNAQPATQGNGFANPSERQEMDPMAVDSELENGEVTPQRETEFLHPPPTGPKKRSGSIHMRPDHLSVDKRAKRQPSPPRQPQGYDRRRPGHRTDVQTSSSPRSEFRQRGERKDAAKRFISAMHNAGVSFDEIAREIGDARMLRILFKELGLNAPSEEPQTKQPQTTTVVIARPQEQKVSASAAELPALGSPLNTTVAKPAIKPVPKAVIVAKAPASADRTAYLAKLQAAKNKKNEALLANTNSSPVLKPAISQVLQAPQSSAVDAAAATAALVQNQPVVQQPKKAKVQTELIRKRLEALKGEQARKQEAERLANAAALIEPNNTSVAPSVNLSAFQTPARSANGTPQVVAPTYMPAPQQPLAAPAQAYDFTSQFPGLPGLFMTGTPTQASAVPVQFARSASPHEDVTAPAGAVATADSSHSDEIMSDQASTPVEVEAEFPAYTSSMPAKPNVPSSGQATPKHPFNQNRYDSNDDSVIIHVSDEEESELDDMEEDDEAAPPPASKPVTTKPGPLRNFPTAGVASASTSAPATPGATTPGGSAYQRKLQEIEEMHRRIAEMQTQPRKVKAKAASPMRLEPTTGATESLPGLASVLDSASVAAIAAPPQSDEQQPVESSQQMEAKLAQLEQEADVISEQRQVASQATESAVPLHTNITGPPAADATTSSDEDDDDAMDLSSGDDDYSHQDMGGNNAPMADADEDFDIATLPAGVCADELAMMSDSSSDSDESSTDSEDEGSEDDYEPAPADPQDDGDALRHLSVSADSQTQDQAVLSSIAESGIVSSTPVPQTTFSPHALDLAPELQPSASEQQAPSDATPEATTKPYYSTYESPLKIFRDYRFHPQYTSEVEGGFKSLTYSNKLDPTKTMCPTELSNGKCRDKSCHHQHFYNTVVHDAELLRDLGTRNAPWKTEEEKTRWVNGLSEVVKQLRMSNQGTDVNAIAARIAQYRRDFIGTPDQVLNLNPASALQ